MTSKPTTPLMTQRHQFQPTIIIETLPPIPPTRIPQPSPQPLRRSLSLRLRKSNFDINFSSSTTPSPSSATTTTTTTSNDVAITTTSTSKTSPISNSIKSSSSFPFNTIPSRKQNCGKELSTSKSLSFIHNMDHSCRNSVKDPCTISANDGPSVGATTDAETISVDGKQHNNCTGSNGLSLNLKNCDKTSPSSPSPLTEQSRHRISHKSPQTPNSTPAGSVDLPSPLPKFNHRSIEPKTPPVTPDSPNLGYVDDDLDSLYSYTSMASGRSTMSSCEHPFVARNGTTFSGRKMKYVVHCSSYAGQTGEDYLTPTQRAQKHIRRLKVLLSQARMDLEQRDSEILRLTKEVVELRLFKASLSSPEERSNSSDAVTVRENNDLKTSQDVSPIVDMTDDGLKISPRHALYNHLSNHHTAVNPSIQYLEKMCNSEMQSSFADSGHFEDITTSSINSKDSYVQTHDIACGGNDHRDEDKVELIKMYEHKIEELIRSHNAETQEAKVTHNDRVEALLQKLADCNTRYADMVPDYEQAKERIRELEKQLEELQAKLQEQEDKQNKMYLHMYTKGQEAERISQADKVMEFAKHPTTSRVSVPELIQQLQITQNELENIKDTSYVPERGNNCKALLSGKEAISLWLLGARKTMYRRLIDAQQSKNRVDPEVTLQFLKSAIYYFLTDKENTQGHLNAIESILGFSDLEKLTIDRARATK